MRPAIEAASGLWVIISVVWPSSRLERTSIDSTASELLVSRLPVGSSASTIAGRADHRPRNGHTLLLAAAQLAGTMRQTPLDREQIAEVVEIGAVERLLAPAHRVGDLDIAHRRQRRQQVELLEDEADAMLAQPVRSPSESWAKSTPSMTTRPSVALRQPAQQVKERGLAGA